MTAERLNLYLAGPMRGWHCYNMHAFFREAMRLRHAGHTVFNPIERDLALIDNPLEPHVALEDQDFDLQDAMRADLHYISSTACDGVALLPRWTRSSGTKLEVIVARVSGKRVFEIHSNGGLLELTADEAFPKLP